MEQPSPNPETRYQVHNSYIWLGSLSAFLAVFIALIITSAGSFVSFIAAPDEAGLAVIVSLVSFVGFMMILGAALIITRFVAYKHLYFTIGQDEFNLYSGIFSKKRVHVPYARIQSVDQHATLLQRIFGVCTVSIDTAGGAANKAVQVPYLTKQQAEWLRSQLFARKMQMEQGTQTAAQSVACPPPTGQPVALEVPPATHRSTAQTGNVLDVGKQVWDEVGGVFARSYQDNVPVSFEYGLSNKELFLAGLSNNTAFAAIIIALVGVASQVIELFADAFVDETVRAYEGLAASLSAGEIISEGIVFIVGAVVGITIFIWLIGALASCVSYGGFRARRRGPRIEVERGLLQHTIQGVNIDRVQAVVIKQTFIRRLIGYCELSLSRVDAGAESTEGNQASAQTQTGIIIHPFLKLSRANEILSGLVPEYEGVPQQPIPLSPKALRRGIVRRALWQGNGFWCAVCTALAQIAVHALAPLDPDITPFDLPTIFSVCDPIFAILYALAIVLFVLDVIGALMWAHGSSFAYNRSFMQVTNAGLSRETLNFPKQKIQFACVRTNPLQRAAGTATIRARTAAGVGGTTISLIDVTAPDAEAWLTWMEPVHASPTARRS